MGFWNKKKEDGEGGKWDVWIGEKIQEARKEKKWTQFELAQELYITQSKVSDYERGRYRLSVIDLGYLALALEKSITYFIPPKFNGATPNDLTDVQKEIIHYLNQASEEADLVLLEQAKSFAKASRKLADQKHKKELARRRTELEEDKKAKKTKGKK